MFMIMLILFFYLLITLSKEIFIYQLEILGFIDFLLFFFFFLFYFTYYSIKRSFYRLFVWLLYFLIMLLNYF